MGCTREMTTRVIKVPLLADLSVGDGLEFLIPSTPVLLLILLATGGGDLSPGFVLVGTVLPDVPLPVAVATFHRT